MSEKSMIQRVLDAVDRPEFVSRVSFAEDGDFKFSYRDRRYRVTPSNKVLYFEDGKFHEYKELTLKMFG